MKEKLTAQGRGQRRERFPDNGINSIGCVAPKNPLKH
jgi:hypothetical protein